MNTFRSVVRRCGWCQAAIVFIASAAVWLSAVEVQAGPGRRMYRRAARWAGYSAAPAYGTAPAYGAAPAYSAAPGYSSGAYVSPPVAPPPPIASMPPFAPYGAMSGGYPPPYFFFSGVVRPGFGARWFGPPDGVADDASPANQTLMNRAPAASQPPAANQPAANPGEPDEPISDQAFVSGLYREILGREPDEPGLTAWAHALHRGMSRRAVTNYFLNSRERARPQPTQPRRPAVPSEPLHTNAASDRPARGAIEESGNPEPMPQPTPQPDIEPEVISPGEEPALDNEPPSIDDGEALPEEVPLPRADTPRRRDREF